MTLALVWRFQLRVLSYRIEKRPDRAAARPRIGGRLHEADAALITAVEVVDQLDAFGLHGLQVKKTHLRDVHGIGNLERTVDAMGIVVQTLIGLLTLEIGQHVGVAPTAASDVVPMVIVGGRPRM